MQKFLLAAAERTEWKKNSSIFPVLSNAKVNQMNTGILSSPLQFADKLLVIVLTAL